MDLYKGNLYWPSTVHTTNFTKLETDKKTDITIIGGGISGMLCAYKNS